MAYTDAQQQAIFTLDRNLIVTAGAGSGKTRVLVDRFVAMLDAHPDWPLPAIVAITFTDKAAREMRDRVRKAIEDKIDALSRTDGTTNSTTEEAIRRWQEHQAALDSARISTIHSLCATLLRSNAAESGLDPAFEVLDEVDAAILRADAVESALTQIVNENYPAVQLLSAYNVRTVRQVLFSYLNRVDGVSRTADDFRQHWQNMYQQTFSVELDRARTDGTLIDALHWSPLTGWPAADDKLMQNWQLIHEGRDAFLDPDCPVDTVLDVLKDWTDFNLQGGSAKVWGSKEVVEENKAALKIIRQFARDFVDGLGELNDDDDFAAEMMALWEQALTLAKQHYSASKAARHTLDYDDLESLTTRLLQEHPAVAKRYRGTEFKHVLVDEFQDTNTAQRDILAALTDFSQPGSLFIVGDPRQSIYAFRGADVSVFSSVREDLLSKGGIEITLAESFRTHQRLVDGFNSIFSQLMTVETGPNAPYFVPLGQPMKAERAWHDGKSCMEFILMKKPEVPDGATGPTTDEMRRWEATILANRIKEMVEQGYPVWDKAGQAYRLMGYGDVTVLFQASKNMQIVEEAFKSADISYVTIAGKGYFDRPEVWDLINLLKALYNPADNLSLASALRSPLYSLSDDDLFVLRSQREPQPESVLEDQLEKQNDRQQSDRLSLWDALMRTDWPEDREYDPPLPDTAQVAYARESLRRLKDVAGRVTIAELLIRALDETGYLATLSGLSDGSRRVGNVEKLIELARRSGRVMLGEFTLYLDDLTQNEAREGEAVVATEGAVQLMTIHQSKGLEFPVVALFDASRQSPSQKDVLIFDPLIGPVCKLENEDDKAPQPFAFRLAKRYGEERQFAEKLRVLYVALTRAQDYVIVSGQPESRGSEDWLKMLTKTLGLPDAIENGDFKTLKFEWGECLVRIPTEQANTEERYARSVQAKQASTNSGWDRFSSTPFEKVKPTVPSLLTPVPVDRLAPARMLNATEIATLGESKASGFPHKFRHQVLRDSPPAVRQIVHDSGDDLSGGTPISRRIIGDMVHQALRWWRLPSLTPNLHEILNSYAWEQGITDPDMIKDAVNIAADLLARTERSGVIQQINDAKQVYRELPFTYKHGERIINGVIDVLYFTKYGQWHLVDYKTSFIGREDGESLGSALRHHAVRYYPQVGVYAAAIEAMTGQAPTVYLHYIRYVETLTVSEHTWRDAISVLDDDITRALEE